MISIGTFERNVEGRFVYKRSQDYVVYRAQGMVQIGTLPRTWNVWQNIGQAVIFFKAKGW